MTDFTNDFLQAFNHAMLYEVGSFWNPEDADVISGQIDTKEQRKKVGYVNIPADRGGETKYGIAKNANPSVDVRNLDLAGAMDIYFTNYWLKGKCDRLTYPLTVMHFDGCCNHGIGRASKFLQRAAGVEADGSIGDQTVMAIEGMDSATLIQNLSDIRTQFYSSIVQRDPSQGVFLNGWMRRINEVTQYTLSHLQ